MTYWKRIFERLIEGVLLSSSLVTSLTVVLITVFLFVEGAGLFFSKPLEEGYMIALNKNNPVKELTSAQINEIFNQDVTNWKQVGGTNDSILILTINTISHYFTEEDLGSSFEFMPQKVNQFIDQNPGAILYFAESYIPGDFKGRRVPVKNVGLAAFLTGTSWYPTTEPVAQMGILPLILGTLWVSIAAIMFALPLGLAISIYLAEVAHPRVRNTLKPIIELLAGIPSVIYGFFGLIVIVPAVQDIFGLPVGETALVGAIILALMALPTIITISEDALRTVPRSMKEASLALGATHWQTIVRVCVPFARSGITAGIILGIGRAIGETMAVLMVTGNASTMPTSLLGPVRTIPATIAAELGEAPAGGLHYKALFALGIVLFIITLIINISVEMVKKNNAKKI